MTFARKKSAVPMLKDRERTKAIVFNFIDPARIIEWDGLFGQRHGTGITITMVLSRTNPRN
jgi:hypothetical protein